MTCLKPVVECILDLSLASEECTIEGKWMEEVEVGSVEGYCFPVFGLLRQTRCRGMQGEVSEGRSEVDRVPPGIAEDELA